MKKFNKMDHPILLGIDKYVQRLETDLVRLRDIEARVIQQKGAPNWQARHTVEVKLRAAYDLRELTLGLIEERQKEKYSEERDDT